jgi:hypothetical protein
MGHRNRILGVALCAGLAWHAAAAQESPITLLGYRTSVPSEWVARPPSSTSRLAQFVVPGRDSSDDAEVVVFFFGASQGGNVEANLERWREQFSGFDGSPVHEVVTRDTTTFPLTIAEFEGTYRRGIGMGSPDSVRTGQALVATIVETPRGALFIQLFGPASHVAAARGAFLRFVKDLR